MVLMIVYRLGRTKWAKDVSGEGARKYGGRWNHAGTPCIYAADSRALAVLEYSVHVPLDDIPRVLSFTSYTIPNDRIHTCSEAELPGNWRNVRYSATCQDFGTALLNSHLILQIPSVVLPYAYNYLLNPIHPDFSRLITLTRIEDYSYGIRIKS